MTRRRKEPTPQQVIRFIADNESLAVTCDEFVDLPEERLREILREFAGRSSEPIMPPQSEAAPRKKAAGERLQVFSDGASRGNPGPAGAGWVIRSQSGSVLQQGRAFLGIRTNNEAEYEALIRSLQAAAAIGAGDVAWRSDSELLVRQINGQYQVRNERLGRLHRAARDIIQTFHRFEARHVPREQNSAADEQANMAIDEASKAKRPGRSATADEDT